MNSETYKNLCNQPNVFSRHDLEVTEKALHEENLSIALQISEFLQKSPVPKPKKHLGNGNTDYFFVTLSQSDAEKIVDILIALESGEVKSDGIVTAVGNFYGELADKWTNYISYLER